jgi:hypothetical protein
MKLITYLENLRNNEIDIEPPTEYPISINYTAKTEDKEHYKKLTGKELGNINIKTKLESKSTIAKLSQHVNSLEGIKGKCYLNFSGLNDKYSDKTNTYSDITTLNKIFNPEKSEFEVSYNSKAMEEISSDIIRFSVSLKK